jgi:hypothetical protein
MSTLIFTVFVAAAALAGQYVLPVMVKVLDELLLSVTVTA